MRRLCLIVLFFLVPLVVQGKVDAYHFDDPKKEARYKQLIDELRCLVCQNQNLADSNAELAQDMRRLTYEMVLRGESNEQIASFMVERYGDFVLYRPPFKNSTVMLWVGPFLILGGGVLILFFFIRRRGRAPTTQLTEQEQERARRLLNDKQT
jgi:cytochrome c-type biogenesis protein CcmH